MWAVVTSRRAPRFSFPHAEICSTGQVILLAMYFAEEGMAPEMLQRPQATFISHVVVVRRGCRRYTPGNALETAPWQAAQLCALRICNCNPYITPCFVCVGISAHVFQSQGTPTFARNLVFAVRGMLSSPHHVWRVYCADCASCTATAAFVFSYIQCLSHIIRL